MDMRGKALYEEFLDRRFISVEKKEMHLLIIADVCIRLGTFGKAS